MPPPKQERSSKRSHRGRSRRRQETQISINDSSTSIEPAARKSTIFAGFFILFAFLAVALVSSVATYAVTASMYQCNATTSAQQEEEPPIIFAIIQSLEQKFEYWFESPALLDNVTALPDNVTAADNGTALPDNGTESVSTSSSNPLDNVSETTTTTSDASASIPLCDYLDPTPPGGYPVLPDDQNPYPRPINPGPCIGKDGRLTINTQTLDDDEKELVRRKTLNNTFIPLSNNVDRD